MARLDGQDGASDGQVVFVCDLASCTKERADTNTFEDASDAEELGDRRHGEGVDAFFRGGGAERGGQEVYMGLLVAGDFGQACVGGCWDAGGDEVGGGELGETLAVEGCFEVLEG
jgi:hypothetical protein